MTRRLRLDDDRGAAGVETSLAVIALLLVLFFVVGSMRIVGANGDVSSAARAGARAASTARTNGEAQAAARTVVTNALAGRGVACTGGPSVGVSGAGVAGQAVTVTVTCTVSLSDAVMVGFPGSRSVTVSAVEFVDAIRGDG